MSYYWFERFDEQDLPALEAIARENGLAPQRVAPPMRSWFGNPFGTADEEDFALVGYDPSRDHPLLVQVARTHGDADVRAFMRRLISIRTPQRLFSTGKYAPQPYDMREFEG